MPTNPMQLGMVGLGRMGANLVRRLMHDGHHCVVFDVSPEAVKALEAERATGASSVADLVGKLAPPRAAWVMVPFGEVTRKVIEDLASHMDSGDTIIDGGNSSYRDDIRRAAKLSGRGIHLVDCGTSGGVWGTERGYCLVIGGEADVVGPRARVPRGPVPGPVMADRAGSRSLVVERPGLSVPCQATLNIVAGAEADFVQLRSSA